MKKNILWYAVALMTAFVGVSCSNEDDFSEVPTPKPSEEVAENIVTFTATLDTKGGSGMRAVSASGVTTWVANEEILISYKNTSNVSQEAKATVESVDANGKATITASLVDPKDESEVYFYYPYESWKSTSAIDFASGQDGSLSKLSQYFDYAVDDSFITFVPYTLSVSGGVATLPSSINMVNYYLIWKLSFTDGTNDITSNITKLEIHASAGGTTDYTITPTAPITDYFYVVMGDLLNDDIVITAHTSSGIYRRAKSGITLEMGKIYTTTGLALTKIEVGKVFGADGNIYTNSTTATAAGTSAVAMICYVGSGAETNTTFNHGLALALTEAGTGATWCSQTSAFCLGTHYDSYQTNDMAGIANTDALVGHGSHTHAAASMARNYNSGTHPTGTSAWFLPSAGQWDQMFNACKNVLGTRDSNLDLLYGFGNVGGTNLQRYGSYWSSTELYTGRAWGYNFGTGNWFQGNKANENSYYVRSALAF